MDHLLNLLSGEIYWLVLPHSDHGPSVGTEGFGHFIISQDIARQLRLPIRPIRLWKLSVLRAAVPKASIYINHNAGPSEDDVCLSAQTSDSEKNILAKAEASLMHGGPQPSLWSSINSTIGLHRCRSSWT